MLSLYKKFLLSLYKVKNSARAQKNVIQVYIENTNQKENPVKAKKKSKYELYIVFFLFVRDLIGKTLKKTV